MIYVSLQFLFIFFRNDLDPCFPIFLFNERKARRFLFLVQQDDYIIIFSKILHRWKWKSIDLFFLFINNKLFSTIPLLFIGVYMQKWSRMCLPLSEKGEKHLRRVVFIISQRNSFFFFFLTLVLPFCFSFPVFGFNGPFKRTIENCSLRRVSARIISLSCRARRNPIAD